MPTSLPSVNALIGDDVTEGGFKTAISQMLMYMSEGGMFPSGGIIMWSGSSSDIPSGWALCDGNNGTPNLQGRFVIGSNSTYAVGQTGGAVSATTGAASGNTGASSGNTGATTLTTSQIPSHSHSLPYSVKSSEGQSSAFDTASRYAVSGNKTGNSGGGGSHTHSLNAHTHSLNAHTHTVNNMPPYYALCYIMKL